MPALPDIEIGPNAAAAVEAHEMLALAEYWDDALTLPGNLQLVAWWLAQIDRKPSNRAPSAPASTIDPTSL